ncbi:hypothetical protein CSB66_2894 [Enterobacter hormaechei]|nr:hypothetical protein CSC35_0948 [Enterobacter hormaechei]RCG82065.1 hypothetical protein CSB66_2894 [Enterobacter hormaechei]
MPEVKGEEESAAARMRREKVKKKRTMAVQGAFQFCTNG